MGKNLCICLSYTSVFHSNKNQRKVSCRNGQQAAFGRSRSVWLFFVFFLNTVYVADMIQNKWQLGHVSDEAIQSKCQKTGVSYTQSSPQKMYYMTYYFFSKYHYFTYYS